MSALTDRQAKIVADYARLRDSAIYVYGPERTERSWTIQVGGYAEGLIPTKDGGSKDKYLNATVVKMVNPAPVSNLYGDKNVRAPELTSDDPRYPTFERRKATFLGKVRDARAIFDAEKDRVTAIMGRGLDPWET